MKKKTVEGEGTAEAEKAELEEAMARWTEMVESFEMLQKVSWVSELPDTAANKAALETIFSHGMTYCHKFLDGCLQPWDAKDWPLNPRVWLAEMERVLKTMSKRRCLPYWLRRPHERNIRDDASASADGSTDPGNYILDVVVHALRLWNYCEPSKVNIVIAQSIHEYGARANKSAKGPVNLRGNIVEAMQRNLQQAGAQLNKGECEYDPVDYWLRKRRQPIPSYSTASSSQWEDWSAGWDAQWWGGYPKKWKRDWG